TGAPQRAVPEEVEALILKLLAKRPDQRFGTAEELRAALEETLRAPAKRQEKVRRIGRSAIGAVMTATALAAVLSWRARHVEPRPDPIDAESARPIAGEPPGAATAPPTAGPMPPTTGGAPAPDPPAQAAPRGGPA